MVVDAIASDFYGLKRGKYVWLYPLEQIDLK